MNYNEKIIEALSAIGLQIFPDLYDSEVEHYDKDGNLIEKLTEWLVFNYVDERPSLFADDEDVFTKTVIDIHCYTPDSSKIFTYKKQIKNSLRAAEFVINSTNLSFENDTKMFHITVTVSDDNFTEV